MRPLRLAPACPAALRLRLLSYRDVCLPLSGPARGMAAPSRAQAKTCCIQTPSCCCYWPSLLRTPLGGGLATRPLRPLSCGCSGLTSLSLLALHFGACLPQPAMPLHLLKSRCASLRASVAGVAVFHVRRLTQSNKTRRQSSLPLQPCTSTRKCSSARSGIGPCGLSGSSPAIEGRISTPAADPGAGAAGVSKKRNSNSMCILVLLRAECPLRQSPRNRKPNQCERKPDNLAGRVTVVDSLRADFPLQQRP